MDSVSVDGTDLTIDGELVTFEYEVGEIIEIDEVVVARLKVPVEEVYNRNVVAVDETGTKRWTIPEANAGSIEDNPYMNIYIQDGELWAGDWRGMAYQIDLDTGEILDNKFRK